MLARSMNKSGTPTELARDRFEVTPHEELSERALRLYQDVYTSDAP